MGLLVEGNEITNVRENGNHSDCLQAVWVGDHMVYRKNYLHDNRCQGFFIKDQASTVNTVVAEDNLMLRNNLPCDRASRVRAAVDLPALRADERSDGPAQHDLDAGRRVADDAARSGGRARGVFDQRRSAARGLTPRRRSAPATRSTNNVSQGAPEGSWPATGFSTVSCPAFANAGGR